MKSIASFSLALPTAARCERPKGRISQHVEGISGDLGAGAREARIGRALGRRGQGYAGNPFQLKALRWERVSRRFG